MAARNKTGSEMATILEGFYRARSTFYSYYGRHNASLSGEQANDPNFRELYGLVENMLFPLKEKAHHALRSEGNRPIDLNNDLFDIVIGELYHEADDLRAAVHQAKDYKPRLLAHQQANSFGTEDKKVIEHLLRYVGASEKRIGSKYEEVRKLFDEATDVLEKRVLPSYQENMELLRPLALCGLEGKGNRFSTEDLSRIFKSLYGGGEVEAYLRAALDCMKGYHVKLGVDAIKKGITLLSEIDPDFASRHKSTFDKLVTGFSAILDKYSDSLPTRLNTPTKKPTSRTKLPKPSTGDSQFITEMKLAMPRIRELITKIEQITSTTSSQTPS